MAIITGLPNAFALASLQNNRPPVLANRCQFVWWYKNIITIMPHLGPRPLTQDTLHPTWFHQIITLGNRRLWSCETVLRRRGTLSAIGKVATFLKGSHRYVGKIAMGKLGKWILRSFISGEQNLFLKLIYRWHRSAFGIYYGKQFHGGQKYFYDTSCPPRLPVG